MKHIQNIDLSRMMERPKCAVLCRSVEELELFYSAAESELSEYLHWDCGFIHTLWNEYKENTGFTLFESNNDGPYSMTYCYEAWFRDRGYELIEFSDLCNIPDIDESEVSLDVLFG